MQCRLRDRTYSAPLFVNVRYTRGRQIVVKQGVPIGKIPVMLKSDRCVLAGKSEQDLWKLKECPFDPGGYFVVKGVEKVILIQEQLSKNRIIIEKDSKGNICGTITSSTHERKSRTGIVIKSGKLFMKHNTLGDDMPIVIVLKAMGIQSDQEIVAMVGSEPDVVDAMAASLEDSSALKIFTQQQALAHIGTRMRAPRRSSMPQRGTFHRAPRTPEDEARDVLATVVLSHIDTVDFNFRPKAVYIAYTMRRVLLASRDPARLLDDKDYYGNKRLELAGQLMALLFEDTFKRFNNDLQRQANAVLSKPNRASAFDIVKSIRTDTITTGFVHALSTGNWSLKRFKMERAGITQVLSRLSYIAALGMMTRVNSQFEKTRKVSGPRSLQPSQWGMLCPCDTPEGEACGLVKNLALLAHVTSDQEDGPITRLCFDLGTESVDLFTGEELNGPNAYLVMLNGALVGVHARPQRFVQQIRKMRRMGMLGEFVSVMMHTQQRCVHIAADGGRICRPLLIVSTSGKPALQPKHLKEIEQGVRDIKSLIQEGIVEYVDVNEENNCMIALREENIIVGRTTHLEIEPCTIMGVVAGLIPYPHHNQSPRNTYQCAMGKQAIGTIAMNQFERVDTLLYAMVYPMAPMVKTKIIDLVNFDKVPGGQNAIVAVMSQTGYDIEDATVLNKASLDRGFGRCMCLRKHNAMIKRYPNNTYDRIVGPPSQEQQGTMSAMMKHRVAALDPDGLCRVGEKITFNQVRHGDVTVMGAVASHGGALVCWRVRVLAVGSSGVS